MSWQSPMKEMGETDLPSSGYSYFEKDLCSHLHSHYWTSVACLPVGRRRTLQHLGILFNSNRVMLSPVSTFRITDMTQVAIRLQPTRRSFYYHADLIFHILTVSNFVVPPWLNNSIPLSFSSGKIWVVITVMPSFANISIRLLSKKM